jgi:hypothetical protein
MCRESGIVSGAKPTFFEPGTKGDAEYTQLLTGKSYVARFRNICGTHGMRSGERVEFGADQCTEQVAHTAIELTEDRHFGSHR